MSELYEDYLSLLKRKEKCMKEIKSLTQVQLSLIENDDFIGLNKNLENREKKMRECDAISELLNQIDIQSISNEELIKADNVKTKIKEILNEIIVDNKAIKEKAQMKMEDYRSRIKDINVIKKGVNGYTSLDRNAGSYYFNKKN